MKVVRRPDRLVPLVGLVIVGVWALASLWWPFCYDQAIFAWVGDVVRHGGMPYRDAWDVKGPAAYLQYAAIEAIFGKHMWSVRLGDILFLAAGLWGVAKIASRLAGREAALWAMAVAGAWYAASAYGDVSQPDGWGAMLTAVAVGLAVSGEWPSWPRAVACGLLMSWTALFKPTFVLFAPLPLLAFSFGDRKPAARDWLGMVGAFAAGYAALAAVVLGWIQVRGAMPQMREVLFVLDRAVYWAERPMTASAAFGMAAIYLLVMAPLLVPGVYGLVRVWSTGPRRLWFAIAGWAVMAEALVVIQGRFYPYHWHPLIFGMAPAAGAGIAVLASRVGESGSLPSRRVLTTASIIGALLLLAPLSKALPRIGDWARSVVGLRSWESYYSAFCAPHQPGLAYVGQRDVARYLRQHTRPGEMIYVWGFGPLIMYLSGRQSPTRFPITYPFVATRHTSPHFWAKYSSELMRDLTAHPPAYFVVGDRDGTAATPQNSKSFLADFPALARFLHSNYSLATVIGSFDIYRRHSDAARVGQAPPCGEGSVMLGSIGLSRG